MLEILGLTAVFLVSFYTASYGLWAWRNKKRFGAVGVFILSAVTMAAPVGVWFYHRLN